MSHSTSIPAAILTIALLCITMGATSAHATNYVIPSLAVSPLSGNVGTVVTLTGFNLKPNTFYSVLLPDSAFHASFTSTSTGQVPTTPPESFSWPAMPTSRGKEMGDSKTVCVSSTDSSNNCDGGITPFLLQAAAALNTTFPVPGRPILLTGLGLVSGQAYNIIFNYWAQTNGTFSGYMVGSLLGRPGGSGNATFKIPSSASPGTYLIQLVRGGCGSATSCAALAIPPTLFDHTRPISCPTLCFVAIGPAVQASLAGLPALTITYMNYDDTGLTVVVYAVARNSSGQTVYYTTAAIAPRVGGTATAFLIVAGLPSGSYSVTIFAVTPGGMAISTASTLTIVV